MQFIDEELAPFFRDHHIGFSPLRSAIFHPQDSPAAPKRTTRKVPGSRLEQAFGMCRLRDDPVPGGVSGDLGRRAEPKLVHDAVLVELHGPGRHM